MLSMHISQEVIIESNWEILIQDEKSAQQTQTTSQTLISSSDNLEERMYKTSYFSYKLQNFSFNNKIKNTN